jgi:uncharacterized phage protein gp47/JayE
VRVPIIALVAGDFTRCEPGTPISIARPIDGINSGGETIGDTVGGTDQERQEQLRSRMLARYRAPPHGGARHDYIAWALEVPGVTRAWCSPIGYGPGTVAYTGSLWDEGESQWDLNISLWDRHFG